MLLPVQSVGVMGDGRTYENVVALRAVQTDDFMTADWSHLPYDLLAEDLDAHHQQRRRASTASCTTSAASRRRRSSGSDGAGRTASGVTDREGTMASRKSKITSKKAQSTLENLQLAIHGVTAPFSCEGTFVPDSPVTLIFKDRTRFEVIRAKNAFEQKNELKPLLEHCKPAPFGDGKKTRYDRTVRDALQLKAEKGGFSIENFDPESAGILKQIQRELVPHDPNPISAELYTVNVYTDGGHFAPHKDTPRGDDMFGTLVVCLPSQFRGRQIGIESPGSRAEVRLGKRH